MKIFEVPRGTVVVGVDGSAHSTRAADWAADAAARERRPLTLVHSCDPLTLEEGGVWSGLGDWSRLRKRAQEPHGEAITASLSRITQRHPDLVVHLVEEYINPALALTELSEQAHLLVVGSHGRGPVTSALLGSVSSAVATRSHCPTVVTRPDSSGADRDGITVVVDRDHPSTATVELGFRHAASVHRPLRIVLCHHASNHASKRGDGVVTSEQLHLELSELCAGLAEKFPDVTAVQEVQRGPLDVVAVGATVTADLTVLGRRTHRGLTALVPSTLTTSVLEHARGPVAIVPERTA